MALGFSASDARVHSTETAKDASTEKQVSQTHEEQAGDQCLDGGCVVEMNESPFEQVWKMNVKEGKALDGATPTEVVKNMIKQALIQQNFEPNEAGAEKYDKTMAAVQLFADQHGLNTKELLSQADLEMKWK